MLTLKLLPSSLPKLSIQGERERERKGGALRSAPISMQR